MKRHLKLKAPTSSEQQCGVTPPLPSSLAFASKSQPILPQSHAQYGDGVDVRSDLEVDGSRTRWLL